MTERKILARPITARVRIRPTGDASGRDQHVITRLPTMQYQRPALPSLAHVSKSERYAQQIKEVLRLNDILRIGLSLEDVLQQIINSFIVCTGFRELAMFLVDEGEKTLSPVAFSANTPEEDKKAMRERPMSIGIWSEIMHPEFQISQSYFIPHEQALKLFAGMPGSVTMQLNERSNEPGRWHPEDMFFCPLFSTREDGMLGFISLDDPEDGVIPTQESVEIVELFASKAALAVDNVRYFQERENERALLGQGMDIFHQVLQKLQSGDFRVTATAVDPKFQQMTDIINTSVGQLNNLLQGMRSTIKKVNEGTHSMQVGVGSVTNDMLQQNMYMHNMVDAIGVFTGAMGTIVEEMGQLDQMAKEVIEVMERAQEEVDRAIREMSKVREMTQRSEQSIKSFGETGQSLNESIEVLEDLAMRMHLVSLNSAIEASRAGENGRGFVAVAQELRTLAIQNTEGVRRMRDTISEMDQETKQVAQSIEKSMQQVVQQTEIVTEGGMALDVVSGGLDRLNSQVQSVRSKTEGQLQSTQVITSSIGEVLGLNENVTQHAKDLQELSQRLAERTQALSSSISLLKLRSDD